MHISDLTDSGWHGRRKERHAPALGRLGENLIDIVDKAHAKHFIGFVEHHCFNLTKVGTTALQVIEQSARGCHHNMHTFF